MVAGHVVDATELLTRYFTGPLDTMTGYTYGAPLAVTPHTVIREYEIPHPNAIREAALMGQPPRLWVADVDSNRIIRIDPDTGVQKDYIVPADIKEFTRDLIATSALKMYRAQQVTQAEHAS